MSATDCYYDTHGCLVCPEVPASPAHPTQVITDPLLGWNAGADSITALDGDVQLAFAVDALPVGIVIGLKGNRNGTTAPELITHGFYLYAVGGQAFVEQRERGMQVGSAYAYTLGDTLEIRRQGGAVSYWLAGLRLHDSTVRSRGSVLVNACLYSAGDTIP